MILVVSEVATVAEDVILESLDDRIESIRLLLDDRVHEEQLEDVIPASLSPRTCSGAESPFSLLENE